MIGIVHIVHVEYDTTQHNPKYYAHYNTMFEMTHFTQNILLAFEQHLFYSVNNTFCDFFSHVENIYGVAVRCSHLASFIHKAIDYPLQPHSASFLCAPHHCCHYHMIVLNQIITVTVMIISAAGFLYQVAAAAPHHDLHRHFHHHCHRHQQICILSFTAFFSF